MADTYQSPGAEATNGIYRYLAQQQQAQLVKLQLQREARLEQQQQMEFQMRQSEFQRKQHEDEVNDFMKDAGTLLPGDIPDQSLTDRAKKLGLSHLFPQSEQKLPVTQTQVQLPGDVVGPMGQPVTPPAASTVDSPGLGPNDVGPQLPPQGATTPTPTPAPTGANPPVTLPNAPTTAGIRFAGLPKAREDEKRKKEIQDFIDNISTELPSLPEGSPRRVALALKYEELTGRNAPAGMFDKQTASTDVNNVLMRTNGRTGQVEMFSQGKWAPFTGDTVPKNAHWLQEQFAPPSITVNQQDNRLDKSYALNIGELDKMAQPLEQQVERISRLNTSMAARTPAADALIAPELLTALAGGQGSGLRMNEAEIARIVGGRSNWETLDAKLKQWSQDPSKALSLTDEQRTEMRSLVTAVQQRAEDRLQQMTQARYGLAQATDVNSHRKIMADLHQSLYPAPSATPTDTSAAPAATTTKAPVKSAKDLIKKYSGTD